MLNHIFTNNDIEKGWICELFAVTNALDIMSTSRVPLRGNKLFLPKLQFQKLGNKPLSNVLQLDENSTDSEDLWDEGEKLMTGNSELIPIWNNEAQSASFTRFNVLPPIPGRRYSPKNFEQSRLSASLGSIPDKPSLPDDASGKRTRRNSYLTRQKATVETDEGDSESRKSCSQREELLPRAKSQSNKHLQRSYSETNAAKKQSDRVTPMLSISDFSLEREGLTSKRCKICSILGPNENDGSCSHRQRVGLEESIDRSLQSITSSRVSRTRVNETVSCLKRFNSEGISANNKSSGPNWKANTLILPKKVEKSDFPGHEKRPLSRCQISLDLNEMEYPAAETHIDQNGNEEISFKFDTCDASSSSTLVSSEENDLFSLANIGNSMNFESPQIQILVESIDDAKEDLQKQNLGVPFTSTREQRRRSALCRNNTKQVDDFLLVHNLRDLGLL